MADQSPSTAPPLVQTATERFLLVLSTEKDQRAREQEDLKFHAGDQWPDDIKTARSGGVPTDGTPPVPARPMVTIRSLDQPIAQVINQARTARFAVKISPKSEGASQDTADMLQGLIRAIEYESHAQDAYLWAYMRAVVCGRGYFRVNKAYAQDEGDGAEAFDQVLRIERILNGSSVYLDPWAQALNDPAAAEWAIITEDIPKDAYKRRFKGKSKLAEDYPADETFTSMGDAKDAWVVGADGNESYRIAEYWYTKYEDRDVTDPSDPSSTRTIKTRKVMWATINGCEILEPEQEWDGKYIPIIPVVGQEFNVAGKRLFEGMVRPNIGPCRMINFIASGDAENMALTTKAPWIGYAGQFEGFEEQWRAANTRLQPFLEVNAMTEETGMVMLPKPERNVPNIRPSTEEMGFYVSVVRSTTGVPDAALGHVNPNDRSGKAIQSLQQASEQGTSNYPDQLQKAIQHAGCVLLDLIPHVYDRPGRVAQIITGETGEQSAVMLNQPFQTQQGQPMPVDANTPPEKVKHYDLKKGAYTVVVEVGKSFNTRRQEAMAGMSALAQAAPELVPRFADLWVKSMDIPEAQGIAERLQPPGTGNENLPPEIQAAIGQMQQENQQLKEMLQTKKLENDTKIQQSQIESAARVEVAKLQAQAVLVSAEIKAMSEDQGRRIAILEAMIGVEKEQRMQAADHAHEQATQRHDAAHEAGMATMSHGHATAQADQQADHAADQAMMAAAQQNQSDALQADA